MKRATVIVASTLLALSSCSVGGGSGSVTSDWLVAPDCFEGPFDLRPTFFAAVPYRNTLDIRIQHGPEIQEFSDGLKVLVTDIERVRQNFGVPLRVGLPPGVTPPGVPLQSDPDPPFVHVALYLYESCYEQNIALYGIGGHITFTSIFNGDPTETRESELLNEASFEIQLADPREQPPGGGPIPAERISTIRGHFRFFFERGQPAQPFP